MLDSRTTEDQLKQLASRFDLDNSTPKVYSEFALFATACLAGMSADGDVERFARVCFAAGWTSCLEWLNGQDHLLFGEDIDVDVETDR